MLSSPACPIVGNGHPDPPSNFQSLSYLMYAEVDEARLDVTNAEPVAPPLDSMLDIGGNHHRL